MTAFDGRRAAIVGGEGIVARYPGVLCVARCEDPAVLRALLDRVVSAVATAAAHPGRGLARRLATWLSGPDAPGEGLRFGTIAAAGDELAVFLSGGVSVLVPEAGLTLSGADSAAWLDRLLPWPVTPVVLTIDGVATPTGLIAGVSDLRDGVVPGAAAVLLAESTALPGRAPAAPEDAEISTRESAAPADPPPTLSSPAAPAVARGADTPRAPADPLPGPPSAAPAPLRAPQRADAILGVAPAEAPRRPLDGGAAPAPGRAPAAAARPGEPQARGFLCANHHLNDPRNEFCVICGIRMNERTGVLTLGPRPPLGLLVFDNGATYTVDADYLVGRMPEADPRVRSGELRAITVEDRTGSVSRAHAEVRVDGWDVVLVDGGSRNGTFLAAPGDPTWTLLPPRQRRRLVPGTRVRLGARMLVFESPSGAR